MTQPDDTPWVRRLAATALPERPALLEELVLREFRAALLMSDTDVLPYDESYFAHGLTSLGATEIEQRLEATLGRQVDAASLLNHPTVSHLLAHLRTEVLTEFFPAAESRPGPVPPAGDSGVPKALVHDLLKDLYNS
ncbi:acyl carrier protein [Streptomyces sp. IBSBF 2435]|uniref:acyl carrier protein n=1 Tax=Streptomyces sp. IBSBF 2435 TaxID=2903531 RepID=UPI002FDC70AD